MNKYVIPSVLLVLIVTGLVIVLLPSKEPVPQVCTPNAKQCSGNSVQVCSATGTAWSIGSVCTIGTTCEEGNCISPPIVGKVFKEFYTAMSSTTKDWRVTDPSATATGSPGNTPQTYLPNSQLYINIDDLTKATSAEAIIDYWGGHVGTIGQKLRFNNNAWINIPQIFSGAECYTQDLNTQVPVPLNNLNIGNNMFEGTSGGQTCYNFNWGQWGWYGIVLRVYYDNTKPHPEGSITSPSSNSIINENPTITVQATSQAGIEKVELIAYYDGPDYDGDGIYQEWQESYRKNVKSQNVIAHQYIVGTDTSAPYSFVWDTSMVPDQAPKSIKLKARIKGIDGIWLETEEITEITLQRTGSVKLYKAENVPKNFWVNSGKTMSSTFTIPSNHDLTKATSAKLLVHTWNGIDEQNTGTHYTKINSWTTPNYGLGHYYSFNIVTTPITALKSGSNAVTFNSMSAHHGIEISWPGPSMIVKYSTSQ